jgi:A/G-specific adenine glycosylase
VSLALKPNLFRRALLAWYRQHGRDLPWRRTRDPYAIVVSELMLQQTQVATVIPYFHNWLQRFPTFQALAEADESDVLHAWQGLGYYARARNLHATAKIVVSDYGGVFPSSVAEIRKLPGLGRYTANAVATFALNQAVPIVEANTARCLARLSNLQVRIDTGEGQTHLWELAASLVPKRFAGTYNSALTDLGALICVSGIPRCGICPVRSFCSAINPAALPLKKTRTATVQLTEDHSFVIKEGSVLSSSHAIAGVACGFCPRDRPRRAVLALLSRVPVHAIIASHSECSLMSKRAIPASGSAGSQPTNLKPFQYRRRIVARSRVCSPTSHKAFAALWR